MSQSFPAPRLRANALFGYTSDPEESDDDVPPAGSRASYPSNLPPAAAERLADDLAARRKKGEPEERGFDAARAYGVVPSDAARGDGGPQQQVERGQGQGQGQGQAAWQGQAGKQETVYDYDSEDW
ncbi:hypothetical protein JCM11251_004260 [Rhodosporidiobolus azoricus]